MQAEHPQIFYISDRNSTNMVVFPQDRLKKEDKVRLFLSRSFLSGLVFLIFLIKAVLTSFFHNKDIR